MTHLESFYDELDISHTLTRDQFEQLCSDLFAQMHGIISRLIAATPVIGGFIHEVVLAGGASRMPGIRAVARQLLGQNILIHSVEQDNAVARGAAAIAATLSGPDAFVDFALVDVRPHSLRFQVGSDVTRHQLTRRNRSVPTVANVSHAVTPGSTIQIHIWEEMIDGSEDACYLFKLPEIRSPRDPTAAELSIGLSLELSVDLDITLDLGGTQTRHKFDIESFLRPRKPMDEMADTLRQIMEEENSRNRRTALLDWLSAYCTRLQDVVDNRSEGESLKDRLLFSAQERDVIHTIVRQLQAFVEEGSAERRAIVDIRGRIKIAEEVIDPILANAAKRMLGIAFLENV
jgi:heat shock 70kDa protein 1/2/6/8